MVGRGSYCSHAPKEESESMDCMENTTIANAVKSSLASLVSVRVRSAANDNLSSAEIQSNLSDIIHIAETIKENLLSNDNSTTQEYDNSEDDNSDNNDVNRVEQNVFPTDAESKRRNPVIGATDASDNGPESDEPPKRRLSTPCCIPLQPFEAQIRVSLATPSLMISFETNW